MQTVLRQITACPQPAIRTTTRHSRVHGLLWTVHLCQRHRKLAARLAGTGYVDSRRTRPTVPVDGKMPRCGTLLDHQPVALAVDSHARIWLNAPGGTVDGWPGRLRNAAELAAYIQSPDAAALAGVAEAAAAAGDDPSAQHHLLLLLARAEAAHGEQLGR
ncbi:hypothetical protein ABZV65_30570 [Streptomyces bauhiniae]|uniref:hypothetical protein n=1 Tax=Streptomyces bauhiniae TaxID=2340725 RepID=UPI0033B0E9F7